MDNNDLNSNYNKNSDLNSNYPNNTYPKKNHTGRNAAIAVLIIAAIVAIGMMMSRSTDRTEVGTNNPDGTFSTSPVDAGPVGGGVAPSSDVNPNNNATNNTTGVTEFTSRTYDDPATARSNTTNAPAPTDDATRNDVSGGGVPSSQVPAANQVEPSTDATGNNSVPKASDASPKVIDENDKEPGNTQNQQ